MTYLLLSLLQEAHFLLFIWLGNFFTLTFLASSLKRQNKVSKKLLSFFVSFRRRRFCVLIPLLEGKTLSFLRPCSVKLLNCRPRDIFVVPHFNFDPEQQKNMSSAEFRLIDSLLQSEGTADGGRQQGATHTVTALNTIIYTLMYAQTQTRHCHRCIYTQLYPQGNTHTHTGTYTGYQT